MSSKISSFDEKLLSDSLEGKIEAQDGFVIRFEPLLLAAVGKTVGKYSPDSAYSPEDIVQEVFIRLFRDECRLLSTYDSEKGSLSTWLTIVARSTALTWLRKKRLPSVSLEPAIHSPAQEDEPEKAEMPPLPDGLISPRQELVLKLLFEEEKSVEDTAEFLGVEQQTVRSAKHKALTKLREYFKRKGIF